MVVVEDDIVYVRLDDNNRICDITLDEKRANESYIKLTSNDDFDFYKYHDYIVVDGRFEYSPVPLSEEEIKYNIERERKAQIEVAIGMLVQKSAKLFSDKEALSISLFYEEWNPDNTYVEGDIVNYQGSLYRRGKSVTYEATSVAPDAENSTWIIIK